MTGNRGLAAALGLALLAMVHRGTGAPADVAWAAATPESGVNTDIAPGDDFFSYANGNWLAATGIPDGRARWGARDEINGTTKQQVAALIADAVARRADDTARKIADFHAAFLDEAAIERHGLAPLARMLKGIERLNDKTALASWLGANLPADVSPLNTGVYSSSHLFGLAVENGIHGEPENFAYLLQGGLALPREQYLDEAASMREPRDRYQRYVAHMLELAGFEHATERAAAVLALETAIARSHATPETSANDRNADQHWARADFARLAPGMDWPAFFAAARLSKQDGFVAWQPAAIQGTAALIASEPLAVWQDYLRMRLIERYAEVLPRRLAESALAYRSAGAPQADSRAQRAIDATNRLMPCAVGKLYVDKYFPFDAKAHVQAILVNVLEAFRRRVEAAAWMTPASKTVALAKLNMLYFAVGYPDSWPDDSDLRIDARDAVGNQQRIAQWNYRNALARLDRPVDRYEWAISPQSAMGTLNFLQNTYNFSAALLQPPKFDPAASEAANYGAIGAIIGHEISHYVDTLGADYDARGAYAHWWNDTDQSQYDAASRALADQFTAYRPFADVSVNGRLSLTENVADLAGLAAAFDAYRRVLGSRATNREYLRQQDRLFFIGFARAWRVKFTDMGLRSQSGGDHAPEIFRVATVRNLDAWYDAFDVTPGQRLYLAPEARVRIW